MKNIINVLKIKTHKKRNNILYKEYVKCLLNFENEPSIDFIKIKEKCGKQFTVEMLYSSHYQEFGQRFCRKFNDMCGKGEESF
ncbi:MAG: hypothetical protein AB8U25_01210 [Rickettsiales endosymbiont of Dermacentor nuttalli]